MTQEVASELETVARRVKDGWVIDGRKMWTSHSQIAAGIMNGKSLVDGVDNPVRLQNLDPPLVGVDAVLGDDGRPPGFDRGGSTMSSPVG